LVAELSAIKSPDDAAIWAHRNLPAKNSLTAGDAQIVEARFRARLSTIGDGKTGPPDQRGVSADLLAANSTQKTSAVSKKRSRSAGSSGFGKNSSAAR
jgi:hypothetical protein